MKPVPVLLLLLVIACESGTEPRTSFALHVMSGANQIGGAGATLSEPVLVRVVDASDRPVVNAEVSWLPIEGAGSVSERVTLTNAEGHAIVRWTLGNDPGQQLLLAAAGNASVTIQATAVFR